MIMNKYFDLYWENPLTTYNKIKKYFKPLKPKIHFDCYRSSCAKILELTVLIYSGRINMIPQDMNEIPLSQYHYLIIYT